VLDADFEIDEPARFLSPRLAGHAQLALIRRFSSVLNDERP
jgi:hypothetical protein